MGILQETCPSSEIGQAVDSSVEKLLTNDSFLFEAGAAERVLSGRLSSYLQDLFPDYHVDPEYNRHGIRVKRASFLSGPKIVVPDIVVHHRGNDEHNLLVIELKVIGRGSQEDRNHAHEKISSLVFGHEYQYQYGLYLELGFSSTPGPHIAHHDWYRRS